MRRITIRITAEDAEKLNAICKRDSLQISHAVRSLIRKSGEQLSVMEELIKVQSALASMEKNNRKEDQSTVIAEVQKLQFTVTALSNGQANNGKAAQNVGVELDLIKDALMQLLDVSARQYLLTLQAVKQQAGESFAIAADTLALKNAVVFAATERIDLKKI